MWLEVLRYTLYAMVVLVLAAVAFVGGAWTARELNRQWEPLPPPEVPASQRERARDYVEAALAARFGGRHQEALDYLREARSLHPGMRGLDYQFALTHRDLGDRPAAEAAARSSVDRDEETSNALALLALLAMEQARENDAAAAAEETVLARVQESREADPLNPMPFYVLAEFHRLRGRPDLAVEAYQRALERVSKTDSMLVSTVKAGLAGLRLHHEPGAPPLKLLSINGVLPPEQLFFGAADALLRKDDEAAAGYLREVRTRLPEDLFEALLQDSFFQDYLPAGILNDPRESPPHQ